MSSRRAHLLLAFLTLLDILGFADRSLLAGFSLQVVNDLKMSYAQFSFLSGMAFVLFNALSLLGTGYLADRVNRPRLMAAGMFMRSAMTALARGFGTMAVTRAFVGIGEVSLAPGGLGLLSDVFPPRQRGLVPGVFFLGPPVGVACSYFIASGLGPQLGRRNCFLELGLLGMIISGFILLIRDPRPAPVASVSATPAGPSLTTLFRVLRTSAPLRYLLLGSTFIVFSVGATVMDIVWLVRERGFTEAGAQQAAGGLFLIGGIVGTYGGWLAGDWFGSRYKGDRALFLAGTYLLLGPVSIAFRLMSPDNILFYPFMFIGCINIMLVSGVPIAAATELVPERIRSTATTFTIIVTNVVGYSIGSFLVGTLSDYFIRLGYTEPISWADFWITVAALPAIACFYLSHRGQRNQSATDPLPTGQPTILNQLT